MSRKKSLEKFSSAGKQKPDQSSSEYLFNKTAGRVLVSWLDLFRFSLLIGWRQPWTKLGLLRLLVPMDIARYYEIPKTGEELKLKNGENVLDLSSPKLLATYIANRTTCRVVATDVWTKEVAMWRTYLNKIDLNPRNLVWEVVDGRKLPYAKNSFDKVFSVSVLEHIEKDGDTKAMKELARVLKPGGRLVVTVPVARKGFESYRPTPIYGERIRKSKRVFWARRYDPATLRKRLINPSGLVLKKLEFAWERYPVFSQLHAELLPWSVLLGWLYPLIAKISLRRARGYLPKEAELANALVVLEKSIGDIL